MDVVQITPGLEDVGLYLKYGLEWLAAGAIVLSIWRILYYGPRAFLHNPLDMDPETWRLVGVLGLVIFAAGISRFVVTCFLL